MEVVDVLGVGGVPATGVVVLVAPVAVLDGVEVVSGVDEDDAGGTTVVRPVLELVLVAGTLVAGTVVVARRCGTVVVVVDGGSTSWVLALEATGGKYDVSAREAAKRTTSSAVERRAGMRGWMARRSQVTVDSGLIGRPRPGSWSRARAR